MSSELIASSSSNEKPPTDLRKLIKYEERLGINANQDDYFKSLFRRTTASYRAKVDKENSKVLVKETAYERECEKFKHAGAVRTRGVLHERNYEIGTDFQKQRPNLRSHRDRKDATTRAVSDTSDDENSALANSRTYRMQQGHKINNLRHDFMENLKIVDSPSNTMTATQIRRERAENTQPQWESAKDKRLSEKTTGSSKATLTRGSRTSAGCKEQTSSKSKNLKCVTILPNVVENRHAKTRPQSARIQRNSPLRPGRARSASPTISVRTAGTMISRCATTARRRKPLRNDPVALYHYYQSEWRHFRQQIPGDNSHSNLRWEIRHKLLDPHCAPRQGDL